MPWAVPVGSSLEAIRVAERDVDARKLLVLQEVAYDLGKPDVGADRKLTNPAGIRILRQVGANVGVQVRSAVSTETMRPAFITKRTAGDNIPYFSVNQSPISSAAITPSTEAGHVNVSPSGRLPQRPCSH